MNRIVNICLLVACILLSLFLWRSCNKIKENKNFMSLYEVSQDSLHKTVNKLGQETTTTALLYGDVANFKKLISSKDSTLRKLQAIANKKTISATIINNSTSNTVGTNTTVVGKDTVFIDNKILIYPEYSSKFEDKWQKINTIANKDTIITEYVVYNEFTIEQKFVKKHWYSSKTPQISIFNTNPHTRTIDTKSFAIKPNKSNKLKNFLIGAAVGAGGILLLTNR